MSERNISDQTKAQRGYGRNHDMHTHSYVARVQFGAETWASAKAEKKNKDASGAATRKRDISCPTALRVVGLDETVSGCGTQMHRF